MNRNFPPQTLDIIESPQESLQETLQPPETSHPQQPTEPVSNVEALPFAARVANDGNKEAQVRPVVFRKISKKSDPSGVDLIR